MVADLDTAVGSVAVWDLDRRLDEAFFGSVDTQEVVSRWHELLGVSSVTVGFGASGPLFWVTLCCCF